LGIANNQGLSVCVGATFFFFFFIYFILYFFCEVDVDFLI